MSLLFLVLEGLGELEGASSSAARMNCVMRVETAARSCENTVRIDWWKHFISRYISRPQPPQPSVEEVSRH